MSRGVTVLKNYLTRIVFAVICMLLVVAFIAGCRPQRMTFDHTYNVREKPEYETDITPGLYCLSATGGEGLFHLVEPAGSYDDLVRSQRFLSRAWVEVRANETLKFNNAKIESQDERQKLGCFPTRLRNGFFLIGFDLFPGKLKIRPRTDQDEADWICEVYADAHDLSAGPLRRYDYKDTWVDIIVEEDEFLHLWGAEVYVPPM